MVSVDVKHHVYLLETDCHIYLSSPTVTKKQIVILSSSTVNTTHTEMILIATKTVLSSDSVLQSINLEGSDIKFANTVRNLLDPTLSFQQQISSVCRICYLELRRISAIRHYLSEDVTKKTVVCVCSFKTRLSQLTSF